jgi:hypothetical protein
LYEVRARADHFAQQIGHLLALWSWASTEHFNGFARRNVSADADGIDVGELCEPSQLDNGAKNAEPKAAG